MMVKQNLRAAFGEDVVDQRKENDYGPVVHLRRNLIPTSHALLVMDVGTTKGHVHADLLHPLCHQRSLKMEHHNSESVIWHDVSYTCVPLYFDIRKLNVFRALPLGST